jgi:hypothetical protein
VLGAYVQCRVGLPRSIMGFVVLGSKRRLSRGAVKVSMKADCCNVATEQAKSLSLPDGKAL